ncbi:hypothetical protein BCD67_15610 [Oscillatoriales cyanobacterium USR001]|nr:hypothetical protein BCD67_15610 [Oscillatoriales cyanobacterium USR001]
MRLQNITLLTGTALSLLVSSGIVHPAIANPASEVAQRQNMSTTANTETIVGIIKSIAGEVVTVDIDGGTYRTLRIERRVLGIMGLVPGVKISATVLRGGYMVENVMVIPNVKVTASTAAARTTTTTTTTRTQTQTTTPRPVAPMRPAAPVSRPQVAPAPRPAPAAPVRTQPAAPPVRGLW